MTPFGGWRPSLRMAWRDTIRSKGRSVLVLVMIALPVLAVTALDVVVQTTEVTGAEALERRLGNADARVQFESATTEVVQHFDPEEGGGGVGGGGRREVPATVATVSDVLDREVHGIELRAGSARVATDKGVADVDATEVDLTDSLTAGMWELTSGELPSADDQVVINQALADRGFAVGDALEVVDGPTPEVVGVAESTSSTGHPMAVGPPRSMELSGEPGRRAFLIDAGPVSWGEVRALNGVGATVLSRAVLTDPPPESALPDEMQWSTSADDAVVAVIGLVVVMALLEVVLLAGPAFAVGARRQSRNLALIAASGGTPRQARRVVLASGIVLGGLAAGLGVLLGVGAAAAALPILQRFSDSVFGPFDVPWPHLAGIALFGLASAFLAAVVPAWIASRQDVVAVLAGRRGDRPPSLRSPLLGLVLLGVGIAGAVAGARASTNGEFYIAASAVFAVLGMVLLVPVVVVVVARLSRRLPLSMRYAVRDAARHRTRTVPAVAAVAATVAGVVALGIANASDEYENRATYAPSLPMGQASVSVWQGDPDWTALSDVVSQEIPEAEVTEIRGIPETLANGGHLELSFRVPDGPRWLLDGYSSSLGSSVLVSDSSIPLDMRGLDDDERERAERTLAAGGAVLFTSRPVDADEARVIAVRWPSQGGRGERLGNATVPATYVQIDGDVASAQAVLAPSALGGVDLEPETVGLLVAGTDITERQEEDVKEGLRGLAEEASFYVERGYQYDDETLILLLVLGAIGGVLMIGGTLTATFLALSDARPDLATLSAVGASPRTRRTVAAGYALVVGMVGAVLGAAVGFIPGIAITYPLTGYSSAASNYLDIPWLLVGSVVVALPLLTALIVGLTARSRLPLVARVE